MMKAKPIPARIFKDKDSNKLYRAHYFGMGEHFAFLAHEIEGLVDELLQDGTLITTDKLLNFQEIKLIRRPDGKIYEVPVVTRRIGFSIELNTELNT